jgi:CHAD domain-containing protein
MLSNQVWLAHLCENSVVARGGVDPEGVHQVRVAANRLAVWTELAGRRLLLDDLRWTRRGVGRARDLDVLLASDGLDDALRAWFVAERAREQPALVERLASPRFRALCDALALVEAPSRSRARRVLERLRRRALKAGDALARSADRATDLHRLRRRLRRLRYAREWLGEDTHALKGVQDVLGALNDRQVLLRELASSPLARRAMERRRRLAEELERDVARLIERWRALRADVAGVEGRG